MSRENAGQYRRLARECLEMARTLSFGAKREILIDMAQKWLGLAQEQVVPKPVKQQQQQVQPKDDDSQNKD